MSIIADHPALHAIQRLFDARGQLVYGEAVNQIEHALQCGALAEQAGAPAPLVVAACLHDIGHMQHRDPAAAVAEQVDDVHEALGARLLSRWFGPDVTEPVRLHVDAKRYLCARDVAYRDGLSALSRQTLHIQGGPMTPQEAAHFESLVGASDAVRLRRWDDLAKRPRTATPPLTHFLELAAGCLRTT